MNVLDTMKQALEALEVEHSAIYGTEKTTQAITNLSAAIEQMEKAEPVAWDIRWKDDDSRNVVKDVPQCAQDQYAVPLYTHPAPAVPPTYEESKANCLRQAHGGID